MLLTRRSILLPRIRHQEAVSVDLSVRMNSTGDFVETLKRSESSQSPQLCTKLLICYSPVWHMNSSSTNCCTSRKIISTTVLENLLSPLRWVRFQSPAAAPGFCPSAFYETTRLRPPEETTERTKRRKKVGRHFFVCLVNSASHVPRCSSASRRGDRRDVSWCSSSRSRPSEIDKPEFQGRSVENVHGNDHNKETQQADRRDAVRHLQSHPLFRK